MQNIGRLGISYNGTTREEQCSEYFTGTSNNLGTILHFLRDSVRYPLFLPDELARERDVVLGEFDRNESNPYWVVGSEMTARLFYKYPNRKKPIGSREVVRQATPEQLKAFMAKYWAPNNSVVVVSGDIKPEEAFAQVEQFFGDWPRAADPFERDPLVQHPPLTKSSGAILEAPVQNVLIEIGWQGPSIGRDTTATYAADVFTFILRQPGSRFQRLLVDSGLATSVELGYYTQRAVGPINVIMQTTSEKARAALHALQEEIADFDAPDYFSNQELQNAKTLLGAEDLYAREKPSEYAHTLSFWWASTGITYFKTYQSALAAVSRADIRRYLQTYLIGKPRVGIALLSHEAQQQARLKVEEVVGQ